MAENRVSSAAVTAECADPIGDGTPRHGYWYEFALDLRDARAQLKEQAEEIERSRELQSLILRIRLCDTCRCCCTHFAEITDDARRIYNAKVITEEKADD